jgi:hydrogenase-4 transcriptional activator
MTTREPLTVTVGPRVPGAPFGFVPAGTTVKREADIVADIWREAGRQEDIEAVVAAVAGSLVPHLSFTALVVLGVSGALRALEPLAVGAVGEGFPAVSATGELPEGAWQRFETWLWNGDAIALSSEPWIRAVLPKDLDGPGFVAPFRSAGGARGVVVLVMESQSSTSLDLGIARLLGEALAMAVDNAARLQELRFLRASADAEKRAIFPRRGRPPGHEEVVGAQAGLRLVMERVALVAQSDVPVLILGETGTGKEIVSRAIHSRSNRGGGPFIRVNCGAIPPELIDSQLFGHEKGSFTGASGQHQGWFERADGGTLFLDEIGELPLPAQVRLLRVLQDHQIERVGGRVPIHVDVRIVAATNRDLSVMVKERTFREDLLYRVNGFPIDLPRLRDRREDIPALTRHFVARAATRFGLPLVEPGEREFRLLSEYHWPGNIRELGAVIDRAVILGGGRTLDVAVALGLGRPPAAPPADEITLYEVISESLPLHEGSVAVPIGAGDIVPLAEAMRRHIERALTATYGRIEGQRGAAALLEINPHTLRARMRKLGIDANRFRR